MKLKKNVCLALSLLAFCACTSEDSTLNSSKDSFQAGSIPVVYTIDTISSTADLAKKIALEFPKQSATRSTADKEIKEMLTIDDDNGTPAMYVINYRHNEGFIITSATQDYSPVLAYSDDGNFDVNNTEDQPIDVWIEQEKTNITAAQEAADSIKLKFRAQWLPYVLKPTSLSEITTKGSYTEVQDFIIENSREWTSQGYRPIALGAFKSQYYSYYVTENVCNAIVNEAERMGTDEYGGVLRTSFVLVKESDRVTNIEPLTTARWDQGYGFNTYIPNNYPVGCVAVAVGQIMKYWRYPTSFNWNQITDKASDATANFLYNVAKACNIDFKPGGSEAYDSDAVKALRGYGYTNAKVVNHDVKNAISNISAKRPIYMSGSRLKSDGTYVGHAWACDGLRHTISGYEIVIKILQDKTTFYSYTIGKVYNEAYPSTYLHMNWGYSGSNNAFYNDNNIALSNGRDYKYNRKDIINIYH